MIFNFKGTADAKTLGGKTADEFAKSGHEHKVAEITDFPEAMPASDVKAWAKADTKPAYTAAEVGALANTGGEVSGNTTFKVSGYMGFKVVNTTSESSAFIAYYNKNEELLGRLGFNLAETPEFCANDGTHHKLLHTGNSAKVHIGTSAPSDTSALWVDISA